MHVATSFASVQVKSGHERSMPWRKMMFQSVLDHFANLRT
jgi:hypothetical protein